MVKDLQGNLEAEKKNRMDLEAKVGDIPGKLLDYEAKLKQIVKNSKKKWIWLLPTYVQLLLSW